MILTPLFSEFRRPLLRALSSLLASAALGTPAGASAQEYFAYFGTYTGKSSKGIYVSRFTPRDGRLSPAQLAAESPDPSFLASHPNGRFLYAVNEVSEFQGEKGGGVSAFQIDPATGSLTLLNHQSTKGAAPCHLVVDPSGRAVLVANYGGGSVASYPLGADGRIGPVASFIQHTGKGTNPQRQEGPHAHSIYVDPIRRHAVVADLGLDKVLTYQFDPTTARLTPNMPPFVALTPGAGPRHLAFSPAGRFAYAINEMQSTISVLAYNAQTGEFRLGDSHPTLPAGFKGESSTAEIMMHPTGKFLYGSNRGHDSIAVFSVDPAGGKLQLLQHQAIGGKTPRGFVIDPTGGWLLVGNQGSDQVTTFRIDRSTGRLTPSGTPLPVGSPVSISFVRLK
ncbi:MAG TPA: 6-phosphogluconolactonase [Verrucomicrobiales bacterium]|nr:6-phosphogluconolactonase [Verrucomicrobiales bacterium]